jgi:nitroimidazol reductase NimA-like FMN-containing flavoprotein (pyridoxamine 5'-phosphate oxidase superfamily)
MRKKEREITDPGEIESIIRKAQVCRVAMVDGNQPYVVPVCFGYEKGALYVHGALAGRKIDVLKKNNRVCFEMDADVEIRGAEKACKFSLRYRSVIGTGKVRFLDKDDEKTRALDMIMRHYSDRDFTFSKPDLDSVLVWKIEIDSLSGKKAGY